MAEENRHLAAFLQGVLQKFQFHKPETFWDCESEFRTLLSSTFLVEIVNDELGRLGRDPFYGANWLANDLVLHRGGGLALSASLLGSTQRYIHSLPYHAMYSAIGDIGLSCNVYVLPVGYNNDVFDPNVKLVFQGTETSYRGEILRLRGGTHAYDFRLDRPTLVVKFMTSAIQPMEWLFSRSTLQAWQANDSDLSFTQLRVAADVLGKFAHQSSLAPLKRLAKHPHHAVRWAAIQNVGRLSRSEALALLREAANDPHPHVSRAAQRTLAKLELS